MLFIMSDSALGLLRHPLVNLCNKVPLTFFKQMKFGLREVKQLAKEVSGESKPRRM